MTRQYKELNHRLRDAEKLRLYAQSTVSKHQAFNDAPIKAKARSKNWERDAKAGAGKTGNVERGRE